MGPPLNFGDWIGPYLFEKISGRKACYKKPTNKSLTTVYVTVGSTAGWFCNDSIVWGSGIIEADETFWKPREVCAVRGKYTRKRLGELDYDCPEVYGDPALLLPDFYNPELSKVYRLGVVPHYCNFEEATTIFEQYADVNVIDVRTDDVEYIVREIKKCDSILSSSLHGLILANAYEIPAALIVFSENLGGDGIKFLDYFSAFEIEPPAAVLVNSNTSLEELENYIKEYPQPKRDSLLAGLYNSCPFNIVR